MDKKAVRLSKLLSYWLRHNPSDGALSMDNNGWISIDQLLQSLEKRGFSVDVSSLIAMNASFDKKRWEINQEKGLIRATHGHSVDVDIDLTTTSPPEVLYHGTALRFVESIAQQGLSKMNRTKVHLSEKVEDARKIGGRHGKPFVIEVDAEGLSENGWTFQRSENNIWLTDDIPVAYLSFGSWELETSEERKNDVWAELKKEIHKDHPLFQIVDDLKLIWTSYQNDDELFLYPTNGKCYTVHLTWRQATESDGFPSFRAYDSFGEWVHEELFYDQD